jgi:multimeric flavodoxin WrbA
VNKEIKRVVLISASPKASEKSTSGLLTAMLEETMKTAGLDVSRVDVRKSLLKGQTEAGFAAMLHADALVVTFPLYIFCLPGILMRFLQDYDAFRSKRPDNAGEKRVYTVVNCGFAEADINQEAVRVIQSFSRKTNTLFRFGIMIGGGGMLQEAKDAPFMRKTLAVLNGAFKMMAEDIQNSIATPVKDTPLP